MTLVCCWRLLPVCVLSALVFGAQFAERRGDPVWVMRFGAVLATLGWCSSFIDGGYGLLLVGLSIYSLCWTAILPQLETSAFHYLENDTARYSKVRSGWQCWLHPIGGTWRLSFRTIWSGVFTGKRLIIFTIDVGHIMAIA
ncbi:MAG: hypothetical protein U5L01_14560 [Rheinheimera sp.]|nr:hypothetical protein [Rheinheimera sp.]